MAQQIIYTNHVADELDRVVEKLNPEKVIVIVDSNTKGSVLPRMQLESKTIAKAIVVEVQAGDVNKEIDALKKIWETMSNSGCTRQTLVVNLGGGMITDMGGFAASTFKRGVPFVNVPTTLLAAVDAAIGGKTGVNFNGLKNEIGTFREADFVIVSATFFNTLSDSEILSGYAEMIKHAMISSEGNYRKLLLFDPTRPDADRLLELIKESVAVKSDIVEQDPTEAGLRKALNFGHTAGHAFEEFSFERHSPIPHGYAVAQGLLVELILSNMKNGFPSDKLHEYARYLRETYGVFAFSCKDYDRLIALMRHDKKNQSPDKINFTLLTDFGKIETDSIVGEDEIKAAFDIYRDFMGL